MKRQVIYFIPVNLSLPIVPGFDRQPMRLDETSPRVCGFDELARLRLIAAMEHHFGIAVSLVEAQMMTSPQEIAGVVE
ncbi:hypothetical protein [Amycolatopsis sp. NPDC049868]|uniref:hypothetical protein n=1 Tax=Amycolatopsis sp. NPDC049868 TaxID=3363934 RepID=UPI0037B29FDF